MNTIALRKNLKSGWLKVESEKKRFLTILAQNIKYTGASSKNSVVNDIVKISELFLTLIYSEHIDNHFHEIDILSIISDDGQHCLAASCSLFGTSINAALQELESYKRLSNDELFAFANITQLMCAECILDTREHSAIASSISKIEIINI